MRSSMQKPRGRRLPKKLKRTARLVFIQVVVGLIGIGTIGCDSPRLADGLHPMVTDPQQRHPIVVAADTANLDLVILSDRGGLDARSELDVVRFMQGFRREGKGPLTVWLNSTSAGHRGVAAGVNAIQRAAQEAGVAPSSLRVRNRIAGGGAGQTVTLSYDRIAAIGPQCGDWSESVARNPENLPYPNYGCASQRNLAAMVARPTDFIYAAREVERGGEKRSGAYKTFRGGPEKGGAPSASSTPAATTAPAAGAVPTTTK